MGDPTKEEMIEATLRPIVQAFDASGITPSYLVRKLKFELNYKQPLIIKKKDETDPEHPVVYEEEVKVLTPKAMMIRQDARKDAHKLRGDYPPDQVRVGGNGKPIEHNHRIEPGAAVQELIAEITRSVKGPPTNGGSVPGMGPE